MMQLVRPAFTSRLYVLQHFLKARPLKIGAREAIVDPDGVFPKLRVGSYEIPQQLLLVQDGVRFASLLIVP